MEQKRELRLTARRCSRLILSFHLPEIATKDHKATHDSSGRFPSAILGVIQQDLSELVLKEWRHTKILTKTDIASDTPFVCHYFCKALRGGKALVTLQKKFAPLYQGAAKAMLRQGNRPV